MLEHLVFWHWWLFAAVLFILELLTGSGFLFWTGLSATLIGCILWVFPELNWIVQLLGFAIFGIASAVLWRLYLKRNPIETDKPLLNKRGEQYVGRVFILAEPVINGMGKIQVEDSTWRIRCNDLPAGAKVKITGVDGVILIAEPE